MHQSVGKVANSGFKLRFYCFVIINEYRFIGCVGKKWKPHSEAEVLAKGKYFHGLTYFVDFLLD